MMTSAYDPYKHEDPSVRQRMLQYDGSNTMKYAYLQNGPVDDSVYPDFNVEYFMKTLQKEFYIPIDKIEMKHVLSAGQFTYVSYGILKKSVLKNYAQAENGGTEVVVKRPRQYPQYVYNDIMLNVKLDAAKKVSETLEAYDNDELKLGSQFIADFVGWTFFKISTPTERNKITLTYKVALFFRNHNNVLVYKRKR